MVPKTSKSRGGPAYHKEGCRCRACKGRTQALAAGTGGDSSSGPETQALATSQDIINASLPPLVAGAKNNARKHVVEWIAVKAANPDITNADAARKIGISRTHLQHCIQRGTKEGWLVFEDPHDRLHNVLVPRVVDNIEYWLKKKDKKMTIETAKGVGLFQSYAPVKGDNEVTQPILALKIEHVDGTTAKAITGHIVGRAKQVEDVSN